MVRLVLHDLQRTHRHEDILFEITQLDTQGLCSKSVTFTVNPGHNPLEYRSLSIRDPLTLPNMGELARPNNMENPVWLITGSSQGIGLALTRHAISQGHRVIATSRKPSSSPDLVAEVQSAGGHWLQLDVTAANVEEVMRTAEAIHGRLDVVVNNAGFCVLGSIEETPLELWRAQMETNFFGPVRVLRAALPGMRERRSGCLINVGSGQSIIASPGNGTYAASKFALDAVSEALQAETKGWGIRVVSLILGAFRTDFGRVGAKVVTPEGEYGQEEHPVKARLSGIEKLPTIAKNDPEEAARRIVEIATGSSVVGIEGEGEGEGKKFLRYVFGGDCWPVTSRKIDEMRHTWDAQKDFAASTTTLA
jgi:NAD(P)-dependent dehydrogenase (short-subunit alcohol dehydrogenase family)